MAQFGTPFRQMGGTEDNHEEQYCRNHVFMRPCRMAKDAVGWCRTEAELC